jgi:hypothetical protein
MSKLQSLRSSETFQAEPLTPIRTLRKLFQRGFRGLLLIRFRFLPTLLVAGAATIPSC